MSKVIWQEVASPSCHPRADEWFRQILTPSSSTRRGQDQTNPCTRLAHGSLGSPESAPKGLLDQISRCFTVHPCAQHTDTQTSDHATRDICIAVGLIACTACRRCCQIIITCGQRILTKGCIARGGGFFTGDNATWYRPVWSTAVGCSSY